MAVNESKDLDYIASLTINNKIRIAVEKITPGLMDVSRPMIGGLHDSLYAYGQFFREPFRSAGLRSSYHKRAERASSTASG